MTNNYEQEEFRRYLADADELLRLPKRAAEVFAKRTAGTFRGLGELLDAVLPPDAAAEGRIARALRLSSDTLRALRERAMDPYRVAQEPLTALARAMDLEQSTFERLIVLDHARFGQAVAGGFARASAAPAADAARDADILAGFREAWDRAERDDPSSLDPNALG